jgi:1-deoxy-D-xylulose-5-phosphate reductoisomerase
MPAVMNAANEIVVEAFLNHGLRFVEIAPVIHSTMEAHTQQEITCLDDALEADRWAREKAGSLVHAAPRS